MPSNEQRKKFSRFHGLTFYAHRGNVNKRKKESPTSYGMSLSYFTVGCQKILRFSSKDLAAYSPRAFFTTPIELIRYLVY